MKVPVPSIFFLLPSRGIRVQSAINLPCLPSWASARSPYDLHEFGLPSLPSSHDLQRCFKSFSKSIRTEQVEDLEDHAKQSVLWTTETAS